MLVVVLLAELIEIVFRVKTVKLLSMLHSEDGAIVAVFCFCLFICILIYRLRRIFIMS